MISRFLFAVLAMGMAVQASGQAIPRPDVPDSIKAPAGEEVVLMLHAVGSQIYTCMPGADGKYGWALKAPDAELRDAQGAEVGHHFAGPTWKYKDGSEVTGKMLAKADAPEPDSVPWLLVAVTGHTGEGVLSRVTSIQRIHTKGGKPAAAQECSAARQNAETRSSYEADYYFFAPGKSSGTAELTPPAGGQDAALGGIASSSSAPPPVPETPKPMRIRVAPGVLQGILVHRVNPEYPALARSAHRQGIVVLRINVDREGNVYKADPVSGDSVLVPSAIEAVRQWKYKPFLLNGQAVEVESTVEVNFFLMP